MPSRGDSPIPITPLPVKMAEAQPRELVILGGSFDPPHLAHAAIVSLARESACQAPDEAWICLIPAARSPHKSIGPTATASQRLEMLSLLSQDLPRTAAWSDELDRAELTENVTPPPSYTIDTIERLGILLPETTFYLVLGEDQAKTFHRWRRPEDILARVQPVVALRGEPSDLLHEIKAAHPWTPSQMESWCRGLLNNVRMEVSSTAIRERLGLINKDLARDAWLAERISPPVLAYIQAHRLYRTARA